MTKGELKQGARKKNCYGCKHLDYYEADYEEHQASGFMCNKRDFINEKQEHEFLSKLNTPPYRAKPKRCCELRYR